MKYAFQHIPKSAGTSFVATLRNWFGESKVMYCEHQGFIPVPDESLFDDAVCLTGHLSTAYLRAIFEPQRIVTCLRHPIDRVVSNYFYWRDFYPERPHKYMSRYYYPVDLSLDPWDDLLRCLASDEMENYRELRNLQTWQLGNHAMLRDVADSEALANAKNWIRDVGYLGFMEDFPSFVAGARNYFGIANSAGEERKNANHSRPKEIPDYVKDKIAAANMLDLELYDYARGCRTPSDVRSSQASNVTFPRRLQLSDLSKKLDQADSKLSALCEQQAFRELNIWRNFDAYRFIVAMALLQSTEAETNVCCELRPQAGDNIAALAAASGLPLRFVCADFSDISRRIVGTLTSSDKFNQAIDQYVAPKEVVRLASIEDLSRSYFQSADSRADLVITSLPFSSSHLRDELEKIGKGLTRSGFVIIDDALNQAWPHVTAGVIQYILTDGPLVPLCIYRAFIVLVRRESLAFWWLKLRPFLRNIMKVKEVEITDLCGHRTLMCL